MTAAPIPSPSDADLEAMLDAAAVLMRLPIAPEWRADVLVHLRTVTAAAQLVEAFPLPDEREPAPVFAA